MNAPLDSAQRQRQRGVSLVEALVALAVLSFGMLGVAGVQASLRLNSDISRQRAEAVRIAQERIEENRAFIVLGAPGDGSGYGDIADVVGDTMEGDSGNTVFTIDQTVIDAQDGGATEPKLRSLIVDVRWTDRVGTTQGVRMSTSIAGVAPALAGALGVPADRSAVRLPGGRSVAVPPEADDQGNGTSLFTPPGQGATPTVTWFFNNTTGLITRICSPDCVSLNRLLLSGLVRFAPGIPSPPLPAPAPTLDAQQAALVQQSENPGPVPAAWLGLQVAINLAQPAGGVASCFYGAAPQAGPPYQAVEYFCAVPTTTSFPLRWSGRSTLSVVGAPSLIATSINATSAGEYRVCRYTPLRGAVGSGRERGDFPPNGNVDHPLDYVFVSGPLTNQSFLVIPAGDGSGSLACPADDPSTPFVNGNTWQHQPRS